MTLYMTLDLIRLFADDTSLFIIVEAAITAAACLNNDLDKISQWAAKWLVTFNPSKPNRYYFHVKQTKIDIHQFLCKTTK